MEPDRHQVAGESLGIRVGLLARLDAGEIGGRLVQGLPGRRTLLADALLGLAGVLDQGSDLGRQALAVARTGELAVELRAGQPH